MKVKSSSSKVLGLYAITPDMDDTDELCRIVEMAIKGGVKIVQYRNKSAKSRLQITQSSRLLEICREYQIPLVINDNVKLCLALDADGVHIGISDGNLAEIKNRIGDNKILGASCYNSLEIARKAVEEGADYIAFGSCFSSITKPHAPSVDLNLFKDAKCFGVPIVGIGGITLDNVSQVKEAGADSVAVITSLWNSADINMTAKQFSNLLSN